MLNCSPLIPCSFPGGALTRSFHSNKIFPFTIFPGGLGISPIIDNAETLLPQPLSPTMAKTSPASKVKDTSFTA